MEDKFVIGEILGCSCWAMGLPWVEQLIRNEQVVGPNPTLLGFQTPVPMAGS